VSTADVWFLSPGSLDTPTGGFVYDRHAVEGLRATGRLAGVIEIDGPFPNADTAMRDSAAEAIARVPDGHTLVIDGLALTPLTPIVSPHLERLNVVALIHHLLGDETGLDAAMRREWLDAETAILRQLDRVIVTSRTTADRLRGLGLRDAGIRVVPPGVDPPRDLGFREKTRPIGPLRLLSVATLIPRKGHDLLIDALAVLDDREWRLDLVGDARDAAWAEALDRQVDAYELTHRIVRHGAVTPVELDRFWRRADLFVLPSRHEGWGIALVEAVRWGLPVVATDAGAIPEAVPLPARMLVPIADVGALATALARLMDDPTERRRLTLGAMAAARHLRRWKAAAAEFVIAVTDVAAAGTA